MIYPRVVSLQLLLSVIIIVPFTQCPGINFQPMQLIYSTPLFRYHCSTTKSRHIKLKQTPTSYDCSVFDATGFKCAAK